MGDDFLGDWARHPIELKNEIRFPHSLGLLYSAFTYYLGFKVNLGEYKVMGLAPYGQPKYVDRIKRLIHILPDGSFRLNMDHFCFDYGMKMYKQSFEDVMGAPTRPLDHPELSQFYKDVARSLQEIVNEIMCALATRVVKESGCDRLCMAGGVALNCVANGQIIRNTPVKEIFVQPAAGDGGGAMGAALWLWHQVLENPRRWKLTTSYFGPEYSESRIQQDLNKYGAVYHRNNREDLLEATTDLIDQSMVVGWYQGRQEWGPRALGHRSILGDARHPEMREIINTKIKMREGFRPFAPSVLEEDCQQYFDLDCPSPFMLLVAPVQERIRKSKNPLHAITHVDGSARVQTINPEQDSLYYDLIKTFKRKQGVAFSSTHQ